MKRVGYIYENIYDKKNLRAAIYKAVEGKKDKRLVRHILKNEDYYIEELHTVLKNKTLQLKPSFRGFRKDGPHQKERFITIPSFYPDQVVHWALMLQIQPIIERGMYLYNCGSIPKRGTKLAKKYVERTLKKHNPRYGLKLDIKKFFQSASISKMMELFEKKIKDKSVLNLIEDILINGEEYIQKYLEPKVSSYKVRKYIGGKARNDLHRKSARRNRTSTTSSYHRKHRIYSQEYQSVRTTT